MEQEIDVLRLIEREMDLSLWDVEFFEDEEEEDG